MMEDARPPSILINFPVLDKYLPPMKIVRYCGGLLCGILLAVLAGCGSPGIPRPPSLDLPEPVTDLRAVRKGGRVDLVWTVPSKTTDGQAVRDPGSTRICRSLDATMSDCANPAALAAVLLPLVYSSQGKPAKAVEKVRATYSDNLPVAFLSNNPASQIFYAVSVLNKNGRSAGLSNTVSVPAVVAPPAPADLNAQVTAGGIVLSWTGVRHSPETPEFRHSYRVYRRQAGTGTDTVVGELPLDTASILQLVDHSFDWEKTYFYRVTVVTFLQQEQKPAIEFEGDDTTPATVFAHDIFPPAVPSGLQAVFSGVGQQPFIDLIWAPDADADLAGYNIYRHEEGTALVKMNPEPVTSSAFRDTNVSSGHTYVYSVSAVDVRGNESERSQEASEAVP